MFKTFSSDQKDIKWITNKFAITEGILTAKRFILSQKAPNIPGFFGPPLQKFALCRSPVSTLEKQLCTNAYHLEKVSGKAEKTDLLELFY